MYRLQKAGHKQARPLEEKMPPAAKTHGSLLDDLADEDTVFERTVLKEHLEPKPAASARSSDALSNGFSRKSTAPAFIA